MAQKVVVACVQQRMHLPLTLDEYREDMRRYMRVAGTKQARLVVFPELAGVMTAPPLLGDTRSQLLKRADLGRRKHAGLWTQVVGRTAGALARFLHADFRLGLGALLDVAGQELWHTYLDVFGGLAREFAMTIVAPSAYLPDPVDGVIRNLSVVFDSDGQMLGRQAKVVLHPADVDLAQPGATWDVIPSEVGRIGLILGSDVLYPEVGRLLAYQGADLLVVQAACVDQLLYQKVRAGALARMQDNQLFAVTSFLVGDNQLSRAQRTPFMGKSAILAPQELTPRENGVLVEMGNLRSEGVLAALWDFMALRELWENSETPLRRQVPVQQAGQVLAQLYARLQALPRSLEVSELQTGNAPALGPPGQSQVQTLDDLAIISTTTQRWPLYPERCAEPSTLSAAIPQEVDPHEDDPFINADALEHDAQNEQNRLDAGADEQVDLMDAGQIRNASPELESDGEDETDEMDIVDDAGSMASLRGESGRESDSR